MVNPVKAERLKQGDGTAPPELPEVCGICVWGVRVDVETVECHGAPPTCIPMAHGKNLAGQDVMGIQFFYPRFPERERRCALYWYGEQVHLLKKPTGIIGKQ